MISLHQLRCFLATFEHGSFTGAATALGYAQPSISEQVRLLEQHVGAPLFRRAGRGMVPTEAATALRPHAAAALASVDEGVRAVSSVRQVLTGTVRFGVFNIAHYYLGADLVADVLERHPGVRIEMIGQNSAVNIEQLRRGQLEAALIARPLADDDMAVSMVMRDELVYVSADPARLREPVTSQTLAAAPLVLPDASWREEDSTRQQLARTVEAAGHVLHPKVEVDNVELALDIAARGLADTVCWRGVLHHLADRLPANLGWVPLRPAMYERFAIAHRPAAELSPATRVVVELATTRMRTLAAVLRRVREG
ncbi:LysR family transcriptional regulator [Streptosporangium sp. CA-135522]|uniref:LysR family transcriptional regulator n=1 Tax=Streptosporangium sp. CA-135522 TaxID=3240072 RepID=UPI003D89D61C